jgi:RNA polymerase sigma factor (TIGR02999 family)
MHHVTGMPVGEGRIASAFGVSLRHIVSDPAGIFMPPRTTGDVASLLERARNNDRNAIDALFELLYDDLRRIAHSRLAASGHQTLLNTSALVHEAYLRFQQAERITLKDREHFLAYAASTLRSVVVDFVRKRGAERRGGDAIHVTLDTDVADNLVASDDEILEVHEALDELAEVEPRLVRVVEMRYFAGLTETEIAAALGVTDRTVRRDWEKARVLLAAMLKR